MTVLILFTIPSFLSYEFFINSQNISVNAKTIRALSATYFFNFF